MSPEVCPSCGADVPRNAQACPECGADENTGWSEEAGAGGLDLPDVDFDYGEFAKREFGIGKRSLIPQGMHWFWWVVAIILLGGLLFAFLR
jgi:hypothetical protein